MSSEYVPPDEFGDFRLERRLGQGGMGQVYLARHINLDRLVALKFVRVAAAPETERLRKEAVVLARFSHPNVGRLFYLSEVHGQPFLVMEYIEGASLKERQLTAKEVLFVARALARGLAAVHAQNVLHRDIKPSNILMTPDGVPMLLDFGVAKLLKQNASMPAPSASPSSMVSPTVSDDPQATLSRRPAQGASAAGEQESGNSQAARESLASGLVGTWEYMAPEILREGTATEQSDIYSLGVVLYQQVVGHPPHRAEPLATFVNRVHTQPIIPLRKAAVLKVGRDLAAAIERCLAREPEKRWPSANALADALDRIDTRNRLRRRMSVAGLVGIPLLLGLVYVGHRAMATWEKTWQDALNVQRALQQAEVAVSEARRLQGERDRLRQRAFAAFDSQQEEAGEAAWSEALASTTRSLESLQLATRILNNALLSVQEGGKLRSRLAEVLYDQAVLLDEDHKISASDEVWGRLNSLGGVDVAGFRNRWTAPARVSITTTPTNATISIARYQVTPGGRYPLQPAQLVWTTPATGAALAPGSYLMTLRAAGRADVSLPLWVRRSEDVTLAVHLPSPTEVPPGFSYVPAGRFQSGTAIDERVRKFFMNAAPQHEVTTGAYLIATHETTFEEWIAFLESLPPAERASYLPASDGSAFSTSFNLQKKAGGWQLTLRPTQQQPFVVLQNQPLVYPGRTVRRIVNWMRLPAIGIDYKDGLAYLTWLAKTRRVPGARFCTDAEWERGARGADGRTYPHGDLLEADDANYDATYNREPTAMGPDEVGSHPLSRSPMNLDDMAGNVWEWILDHVIRGGAYYYDPVTLQLANRKPVEPTVRDQRVGLRVCASYPPPM